MIARSVVVLGTSAFFLMLAGIGLRSPYLAVASLPIFLFIVLAHLLENKPHLNITVERTSSKVSIYEGESNEFKIRINNSGPDIDVLEIFDAIPEELDLIAGTNHFVGSLRNGDDVEFTFMVSPKVFGMYKVGPIRVRSLDLLGLFLEEETIDSYFDLKVYPEVQYVSKLQIKPRKARNWPGEILTRKSGTSQAFYGIRSYMPGDSLRRINWKASSRSEELLSNQFMSEFGGDVIIVLDLRSASVLGDPPDSTMTYATRAAAMVAYRLIRDRNRVGMIALGNSLYKIRPGFGRRQFDRLLTCMVEIKPGDTWNIGNLAGYLSMFFSKMTQIIVITSLMDDKSYESVAEISSKGYQVLVISPSPFGFERRCSRDGQVERIAEELVRLEREMKMSLLRRCATVVDWNVRESLDQALRQESPIWAR